MPYLSSDNKISLLTKGDVEVEPKKNAPGRALAAEAVGDVGVYEMVPRELHFGRCVHREEHRACAAAVRVDDGRHRPGSCPAAIVQLQTDHACENREKD